MQRFLTPPTAIDTQLTGCWCTELRMLKIFWSLVDGLSNVCFYGVSSCAAKEARVAINVSVLRASHEATSSTAQLREQFHVLAEAVRSNSGVFQCQIK